MIIVNTATSYFFAIYMSFTFEMDIGKGVLDIGIYNFIRAKQNDIGGAVLIYTALQPRSDLMNALWPSTYLIGKILDRCKYNVMNSINQK